MASDETGEGATEPGRWFLEGMSADGQVLAVSTSGGGCDSFERWEVHESDGEVRIHALWHVPVLETGEECPDVAESDVRTVELDSPLGERELGGCQHDDCRSLPRPRDAEADQSYLRAGSDVVTVLGHPAHVFDGDGQPLSNHREGEVHWVVAAGDLLLQHDWDAGLVARDPVTGEARWEASGRVIGDPEQRERAGTTDDKAVLCDRGAASLTAVDLADGARLWQADAECWPEGASTDGERVALLDPEGGQNAAKWLEIRTFDDGELHHRVEFPDTPVRHQAPLLTDDFAVLQLADDPGIVLVELATGAVHATDLVGDPVGAAEGVVVLRSVDGHVQVVRVVDPHRQQQLWEQQVGSVDDKFDDESLPLQVSTSASAMFVADGEDGEVTRVDPRNGSELWTSTVGPSTSVAVTAIGEAVYIATNTTLTTTDLASGETRWVRHLTSSNGKG